MEWNTYKDKKPTDKEAQYLIEYGWHPDISLIKITYWDGRTFYEDDWETCQTYKYGNQVRHWIEIIPPKKTKYEND